MATCGKIPQKSTHVCACTKILGERSMSESYSVTESDDNQVDRRNTNWMINKREWSRKFVILRHLINIL